MYLKKTIIIGATLSTALLISGCELIPQDVHQQELAVQRSKYEQKIQELENQHAQIQTAPASTPAPAPRQPQSIVENQLFPPNAQPGHCYSRVLTPSVYKTKTDSVLFKPESATIDIIPAQYEAGTERLLVKEASTKIIAIPATYKTVTERVMVKPAHSHLKKIPATYKTVFERVIDKPAHTAWKRGAGFQSSALETRIDNGTGEIMCLVEIPATYKEIAKKIIATPATVTETKHEAEYKTITKRVIATPATTKTVVIPAEYKTVNIERLVSPEKEVRTAVPAVYKNVTSSIKIKDEELQWAEVLCEDNMTRQTVSELQELLKKAGIYRGPIDGAYGPLTEHATNTYAKRNNLPTGSRLISLETAKHIGLKI